MSNTLPFCRTVAPGPLVQPATNGIPPNATVDAGPKTVVTLADALHELAVILPGLKAALDRRPSVERLALRIG